MRVLAPIAAIEDDDAEHCWPTNDTDKYTCDDADHLLDMDSIALTYDENGNLRSRGADRFGCHGHHA